MPTPLKSTNYHLKLILNIILIPIVHPSSPGIGTGIRESKSQGDYMKLMNIIGSSSFSTDDVSSTNWDKINIKLGVNEYDKGDGEEWEDDDAGWKRTPVSI
jgi:hypothetical protein